MLYLLWFLRAGNGDRTRDIVLGKHAYLAKSGTYVAIVSSLVPSLGTGCGTMQDQSWDQHAQQDQSSALRYPGITFTNTDDKFPLQAERMVSLLGDEFGVDLGAALKTMDVRVVAQLAAVNCDGKMTSGCTWQRKHYDVVITLTYGQRITDSAFAHEMTHVYACAIDGECDPDHERRELWQATGRAIAKFN